MLIKENSTASLSATFRDPNRQLAAPSGVTYRIDCVTTGAVIRDWTAIDPAAQVQIALSPTDTRIVGGNERERRCVTIIAAYGSGNDDQATDEYFYDVVNLRYLN